MIQLLRVLSFAATVAIACMLGATRPANADTIIGNWEGGATDGWIDWGFGQLPINHGFLNRFAFNGTGATVGTGAVQFNLSGGFTQWASIKLQGNGIADYRPDFFANTKLAIDFTLVASEQPPDNGFAAIGININAENYGFNGQGNPESVTPFFGYYGGNSFGPQFLSGTQTTTWVWDIGRLHDGDLGNGEISETASHVELILDTFSNGAAVYHLDNVRFYTPVPEPTSAVLSLMGITAIGLIRRRAR